MQNEEYRMPGGPARLKFSPGKNLGGPARLKFSPGKNLGGPARLKFSPGKNLGGFTLMEMLVALALFSVVVTIGSDLYLTFQRAARRTEALRAVLTDVRFVTERIAREVREGAIDYDAHPGGLTGPQNALHLRNAANQAVSFRLSDDCGENAARGCVALQVEGGGLESLVSRGVRVRDLRFFILPADNPFEFVPQLDDLRAGRYASDLQPRVTVLLEVDNNLPENHREYIRYGVQTTISSRVYRR